MKDQPAISQLLTESLSRSLDELPATPCAGAVLGARFRLVRELGTGATGTVFEALDMKVGYHPVAVKVLTCSRPQALYRFKQEFRSVAQIVHPNLVGIHELLVCESNHLCLVMDLIDGGPLVATLRARDPECGELTRNALIELVLGVQALHDHDIVHRDLKPANVLLSETNGVQIIDFGLALVWSACVAPTAGFQGTPAYAAPEQHAGMVAGPAADWYAVGVMLHEVLCGRRPAAPSQRSVGMLAPLMDEARNPLHATLVEVCGRLLEPRAEQRATGADLLAALETNRPTMPRSAPVDIAPVGRETQLGRLRGVFEHVASGHPAIALMCGTPGVGKTLLARHFATQLVAAGEAQLLSGRCHAHEGIPYRAMDSVIDSLSEHLEGLSPADQAAVLSSESAALCTLFPVLTRSLITGFGQSDLPSPPVEMEPDPALRVRAAEELSTVLTRLSAIRPLVLLIDDLHWGDADSGALLVDLFSQSPPPPLLLLATYSSERPDDMDALSTLLRQPTFASFVEHIDVPALDEPGCRAIARTFGADDELAGTLAREASGNPQLLIQLLEDARAQQIRSGAGSTGHGLPESALSSDERAVLRILQAAGRPVRRELLSRMDGRASHSLFRKLRAKRWTREYILRGEVHVELHETRRARVLDPMPTGPECRAVHGRLADIALSLGDDCADAAIEHLLLAGREREAARPALLAAERAERVLAFHRQAKLLSHALRYSSGQERRQVGIQCAAAHARAGNALQAAEHYELAARTGPRGDSFEPLCHALALYILGGRTQHGFSLAAELRRDIVRDADFSPGTRGARFRGFAGAVAALKHIARPASAAKRDPGASRKLRRLVSLALATGHIQRGLALRCWADVLLLARAQGDTLTQEQAACALANAMVLMFGQPVPAFDAHVNRLLAAPDAPEDHRTFLCFLRGLLRASSGRHAEALEDLLPVAGYSHQPTTLGLAAHSYARLAAQSALFFSGRVRQLSELSRQWTMEAERAGNLYAQVALRSIGLFQFLRLDDYDQARRELQRARSVPFDVDPTSLTEPWWEVWLHLYRGDAKSALRVAEASRARWQKTNWLIYNHWAGYQFVAASVWAALSVSGDTGGHAREQLRKHAARLQRVPGCRNSPLALHLLATLAHLEGRRHDALHALRLAVAAHEVRGHRLFAACAHWRLSLLGDGGKHREKSEAFFSEEGIVQPQRWVNMLIPGWERHP